MMKILSLTYGLVSYLAFLATFLYSVGFVANRVVPKTIDSGPEQSLGWSLLIDGGLLGLFAVQHSLMARQWFKERWTKIVPQPIERSTYVLISSLVLVLLFWQWRPIPGHVWNVQNLVGSYVLEAIAVTGWLIVLVGTFLIDHFELFGVRQVYLFATGRPYHSSGFKTPLLYRWVRHPIMLGFLIAFWAAPQMSAGRLVFALATTGYILVAIHVEEHDLVGFFGDAYRAYQRQVPMIIPIPRKK